MTQAADNNNLTVPLSPEADSEKTGVGGVNLEARPAESSAHHQPEPKNRDPQPPATTKEDTANDSTHPKVVESNADRNGDPASNA